MPELRAGAAAQWDVDGDKYQAEYEKIRKPSDPATFDEYIAIRDPLVKTKMQLNLIIKALNNEFICSHINQMQWRVADFSHAGLELLVRTDRSESHRLGGGTRSKRLFTPSIIAASIAWPQPDRCASMIAQTTPKAMYIPPPP